MSIIGPDTIPLSVRVKTGLALGLVFGALFALAFATEPGQVLLMVCALALIAICAHEAAGFSFVSADPVRRALSQIVLLLPALTAAGAALYLGACEAPYDKRGLLLYAWGGLWFGFCAGLAYLVLIARQSKQLAVGLSEELFLCLFLIGGGGAALVCLVQMSMAMALWLIVVVSVNDICAFFTGRSVGGPKLAPNVSPQKTVSGALGGLLGGVLVGVILTPLIGLPWAWVMLLALAVVAAAQLGDLAKSFIKRLHDVKDSGSLLPGHGGVLDRIDGHLGAAPLLAFICAFCVT